MEAIDAIAATIKAANTDLARFYREHGLTDLETQVMTDAGPHARITEKYQDYPLNGPLERVGSTGRDWSTDRSQYFALDIDHIDDHPDRGWSSADIQDAIDRSPTYVNWFWSRRGKGVTGIVLLDAPAPDRQTHSATGKRLMARLAADGFPVDRIDCAPGGNSWVWWRGATGRAHQLIRAATTTITIDDLPEIEPPAAPAIHATGQLTDHHRADLEILRHSGCPPQLVPEKDCHRVHTATLPLIDPSFQTISIGKHIEEPNAFLFPRGDGAWTVYRFGGAQEHESWTHRDNQTWTILNPHLECILPGQPTDFTPTPIGQFTSQHSTLSPPLIQGLVRLAETMNIVASPKVGKSWLVYRISLSVATGQPLFGFECRKGRVLIIDNELPPAVIANRIPRVAEALGITPDQYADQIDVISLRGRLLDLSGIEKLIVSKIAPGTYDAIILDAWYRANPGGSGGENDNASVTAAYNKIDQFAARTGATWILVHHLSKGNQSEKSVTDTGAGAGAQSRAADCHAAIREHEEEGHVVFDARVRSFPPPDPVVLKWEFPVWTVAADLDPEALRDPKAKRQAANDASGATLILNALRNQPQTASGLRTATGMGRDRITKLLGKMLVDGIVSAAADTRGNKQTKVYSVV